MLEKSMNRSHPPLLRQGVYRSVIIPGRDLPVLSIWEAAYGQVVAECS